MRYDKKAMKRLFTKSKLTHYQFAKKIGVSRQLSYHYIYGTGIPDGVFLAKIARRLKIMDMNLFFLSK